MVRARSQIRQKSYATRPAGTTLTRLRGAVPDRVIMGVVTDVGKPRMVRAWTAGWRACCSPASSGSRPSTLRPARRHRSRKATTVAGHPTDTEPAARGDPGRPGRHRHLGPGPRLGPAGQAHGDALDRQGPRLVDRRQRPRLEPLDGTFKLTPFTFGDLHCAGQSTLADGRVVVVGGQNVVTHAGTNITALFDPATETWINGKTMTDLRWYATSTTLADGRVLATSGDAPDGSRSTHPGGIRPGGEHVGPADDGPAVPGPLSIHVRPAERPRVRGWLRLRTALLDPAGTGSWTPGPSALYSTNGYSKSAVQYLPGKILRAGGGDPSIKRAMVVDMNGANPAWREIDSMAFARRRMNLMLLADGTVMVGWSVHWNSCSIST